LIAGVFGAREIGIGLALTPLYWLGLVLGTRAFPRFNERRFRQFTLVLLVAVSTGILLA
jgi:uncharacterized membrane protein YfcA